jgi:hypothetical protein
VLLSYAALLGYVGLNRSKSLRRLLAGEWIASHRRDPAVLRGGPCQACKFGLYRCTAISVRIPSEKMIITAINWTLAKCSCPSWNANTDESALRSSLASLEDCSSSLHWWLGFWTFLVALGVALEVVFVVWEYLEELHDFNRGIVHPPERPLKLLFVLGLLGAGLVAAGVSGELWAESKIARVETCIRKGNDTLFLLLSKEAGDAAQSAKIAHDEADAVKGIADEARADAKDALTKAQTAQRELSRAESDARKAQSAASDALSTARETRKEADAFEKELTAAKNDLFILQSLVSARHVVDTKPFEQLKKFKDKVLFVMSYQNDGEADGFCKGLAAALKSPGGLEHSVAGCSALGGPGGRTGVAITGPDFEFSQALAKAIVNGTHVPVSTMPADATQEHTTLYIGAKQQFWIGK